MKKILLPALLLILLSGCSHKGEVRSMSFVKTIGTDFTEDGIQNISLRLYDSENTLTGNGRTIFSAIENAETSQEKTLFSGHTELFISGEGNLQENLELLIKNNRISPSCGFVCTNEKAADITSQDEENSLSGLIESNNRKGLILKRNINDVLDDMLGDDGMAAAPIINQQGLGMAIIDSKGIIGTLTSDEAKGLCWLNGNIRELYIPVNTGDGMTDFFVSKSKTKLTAEADNESINITVEIKINGNVQNKNHNISDARREISDQISALCSGAIAKTVTVYGADVFGLEKCIESSGIAANAPWKDIIPKLKFFYRIKVAE